LCPAQSREKHQGGIENDGGSSLSSHSYILTHLKEAMDAISRYIECQIDRPLRHTAWLISPRQIPCRACASSWPCSLSKWHEQRSGCRVRHG